MTDNDDKTVGFAFDRRGVSEVIGAILVFGLVITVIATFQMAGVPAQNEKVEYNHMVESRQDLQQMRSSILDAGQGDGGVKSVTMDLGTSYPSHLVFVNRPPASGQLQTETVGTGEITSGGSIDFKNLCGLGSTGGVGTKHLTYKPEYNYLTSESQQRYENTVLYQPTDSGEPLVRGSQTFIHPSTKTISLYPLRGDLSESTSGSVSVEFYGGKAGHRTYSAPTLEVPSKLSASQWDNMVSSNDVTITGSGDTVTFDFSGEWTVRCQPVGINEPPEQVTQPFTPPASGNPGLINPTGNNVVAITDMSSTGSTITAEFTNNAKTERTMVEARMAYLSGGGTLSSGSEAVMVVDGHTSLPALDNFKELNTKISIQDGQTETVQFDLQNVDLSSALGTNDYFAVIQVKYDNGDTRTYFIGTSDLL